jgi:hypothetical protein
MRNIFLRIAIYVLPVLMLYNLALCSFAEQQRFH